MGIIERFEVVHPPCCKAGGDDDIKTYTGKVVLPPIMVCPGRKVQLVYPRNDFLFGTFSWTYSH